MKLSTKEKMVQTAVRLFQTKGYDGTSVREIAKGADVNIALISYYFGSKKGLYEYLVTQFLEGYLRLIEVKLIEPYDSEKERLLSLIEALLQYQTKHHYVAGMVHREMTIDSMVVRELMTIYSRKEKHDLELLIGRGMEAGEFKKQRLDYVVIHLRTMMTMPYLAPHYLREIFQITPSDPHFIRRYMAHLHYFLDTWLCESRWPLQNSMAIELIEATK